MSEGMAFDRDRAAKLFIQLLIETAIPSTRDYLLGELERRAAPGVETSSRAALHDWYTTLDSESRTMLMSAIGESISATLHYVLILLDGLLGPADRIGEQPIDFALHLHVYPDDAAAWAGAQASAVRLNPLDCQGALLHEMLWEQIGSTPE